MDAMCIYRTLEDKHLSTLLCMQVGFYRAL